MSNSFQGFVDNNRTIGNKTKKYADIAYFIAVLMIVAGRAMVLTREANELLVTIFVYSSSALFFIIGAYRIYFQIYKNWRRALIGILFLLFSYIFAQLTNDASEFLIVAFAIVGAMDVSADCILLAGIFGNLIMISNNAIVTAFTNSTTDMFAIDYNDFFYLGDYNISFPTYNNLSSTDFAAHYFWIIAAYLWIRGKKISWGEVLALGALDSLIFSMTGSNTTLVCISLLFLITLVYKIYMHISKKNILSQHSGLQDSKCFSANFIILKIMAVVDFLSKYSFLIFAAITVLLTVFFTADNDLFIKLNNILHSRLGLGHKGVVEYGIHLFSSNVPIYGSFASVDRYYNFIDCSYVSILVCSGILLFLFYVFSMTVIQIKNKKYIYGAVILAVCALSCVEEHHLAQISYNFFILMLFSDFDIDNRLSLENYKKIRINRFTNIISFSLAFSFMLATVLINYPRYIAKKELERLDVRANDIYLAVQDNLDSLVDEGIWQNATSSMNSIMYGEVLKEPVDFRFVTGSEWEELTSDPKLHSFYAVYYDNYSQNSADNPLLKILISDDVKNLVGDGSVVIEYDVQSGKMYAVWYSDNLGCSVIEGGGARTSARFIDLYGDKYKEGYSTGDKNVYKSI